MHFYFVGCNKKVADNEKSGAKTVHLGCGGQCSTLQGITGVGGTTEARRCLYRKVSLHEGVPVSFEFAVKEGGRVMKKVLQYIYLKYKEKIKLAKGGKTM